MTNSAMFRLIALSLFVAVYADAVGLEALQCDTCDGYLGFWKEGPESANKDDAPSKVECPDNYYADECICKSELACDGSEFDVINPRLCTAYRRGVGAKNAVAMVHCKYGEHMENNVAQKALSSSAEPMQCPDGYTMTSCTKFDPWAPIRATYLTKTIVNSELIACGWERSSNTGNDLVYISVMCIRRKPSSDAIVG